MKIFVAVVPPSPLFLNNSVRCMAIDWGWGGDVFQIRLGIFGDPVLFFFNFVHYIPILNCEFPFFALTWYSLKYNFGNFHFGFSV